MSQWADQHRRLSAEASAEPGQWDTSRAEYQRGIMDAVNDPAVEEVVAMCSAQVGKTEIANNYVAYYMDQDPCPMLLLQPTLEMAETYSKDRLAPMLRDTPRLMGKVKDARSRDSGNTLLHKSFPGGHLTMAGANSPASLASRPIRIVLCDEVDRYPSSAGTEGDPVDLARKRTTTFWNRKILLISTPTIAGLSRIEAAFEASDKRRYFIPCHACGHWQYLKWAQVTWDKDADGKAMPETARYRCESCGALWDDGQRWQAVRRGEWRATAPFHGTAGFHIWEAYSSWVKLQSTVESFLKSKDYPERLKTWVNTSLGETWQEKGEAPEWERLYERRESYPAGTVPRGGLLLTAGADVQRDRIEIQVVAWGREKRTWLIDYVILDGDTARAEVWAKLTAFMSRTWRHECGVEMPLNRLAIDSGFATQEVYAWARTQDRVLVVKGYQQGAAPVGRPSPVDVTVGGRQIKHGIRLWPVATGLLKSELYGWLRAESPEAPGYCHFSETADEEYFRQLTAEQWLIRTVKGFQRGEWIKMRDRNEALDTRIYARAAAAVLGIDRFSEQAWRALEEQLDDTPLSTPPAPAAPSAPERSERGSDSGSWLKRRGGWLR